MSQGYRPTVQPEEYLPEVLRERPWIRVLCFLSQRTVSGQKKRGWLYRQGIGIYYDDYPPYRFATKKELFELRLKGLTRK